MKMGRMFSIFLSLLIISSSGCLSAEVDEFYGEDISPPISVDDFVLVDENGDTVSMSDFEGKVVVVAFLFTRCPDCLLYTSPSPRDKRQSRMPSSA